MSTPLALVQLGWRPFFQSQLIGSELDAMRPARVMAVHSHALDTVTEQGPLIVSISGALLHAGLSESVTVGDWVLIDPMAARAERVLERQSLIARMAAGERARRQLIAANVDTKFIVTSCNDDFNVSRLERYLALAFDARVEPVLVLTKADLCAGVDVYLDALRASMRNTLALAVDATSRSSVDALRPWLLSGQTVALVGSSGVGKSTLINTLLGASHQQTGGIRKADAKGRHTTTSRQMLPLPTGAWMIDSPGMRELKIGPANAGVEAVFDDIETLALSCRFRDCTHAIEQGCAVLAATQNGQLDERRFRNYQKLQREAANAALSVRERRERDRRFGRMSKSVLERKAKDREPK